MILDKLKGALIKEDKFGGIFSGCEYYCINIENLMEIKINKGFGPADDEDSSFDFWRYVAGLDVIVGKGNLPHYALQDYLDKGGKVS